MGTAVVLLVFGVGITAITATDPGTVGTVAVVMIVVLGSAAAIVSMLHVRHARLEPFSNREPLSPEQIFSRFYKENNLREEAVVWIWREVANILAVPPEKLRPTDKFDDELKPLAGWHFYDDHLEHLLVWARKFARRRGTEIDPTEFKTVDDIVKRLSQIEIKAAADERPEGE